MGLFSGPSPADTDPNSDVQLAYDKFVTLIGQAQQSGEALKIVGGDTKAFYGRSTEGELLETHAYSGIVEYQPAELVITVRAGTRLVEVEQTLVEQDQMLAFEPPQFGDASTIGGIVAAGLSGPRRPYAGSVRDAVLGVTIMNSNAKSLSFGGQVMKNVAGYDVSRLMTGSMGTLGLLLAVSIRVGPKPQSERTLVWKLALPDAHKRMIEMSRLSLPITGMSCDDSYLRVRLAGHASAVAEAEVKLVPDATGSNDYWRELRDQTLSFFESGESLWRLSVPPAVAPLEIDGDWLWDWGGACRWLKSNGAGEQIRSTADGAGGHATLFRGADNDPPFALLDDVNLRLHRRLKKTFDPDGIFNPGRMYAEI